MRVLYGMPAVATRKRRKKSEVVREQQENVADDIINEIEKVAEILVEGTMGVEDEGSMGVEDECDDDEEYCDDEEEYEDDGTC